MPEDQEGTGRNGGINVLWSRILKDVVSKFKEKRRKRAYMTCLKA